MSSPDPVAMPWLTVALEEYKALRAEIIEAIQAQRTIMQLGITGVSVLIGLGVQRVPSLLATVILALLVPAVAVFITTAAWGELLRAARASSFLAMREGIINEQVASMDRPAMAWESWLRRQPIVTASTSGQFLVLYVLTIGAAVVGFATMFTSEVQRDQSVLVIIGVGAAAALMCTWSLIRYSRLRRRAEQQFRPATP